MTLQLRPDFHILTRVQIEPLKYRKTSVNRFRFIQLNGIIKIISVPSYLSKSKKEKRSQASKFISKSN